MEVCDSLYRLFFDFLWLLLRSWVCAGAFFCLVRACGLLNLLNSGSLSSSESVTSSTLSLGEEGTALLGLFDVEELLEGIVEDAEDVARGKEGSELLLEEGGIIEVAFEVGVRRGVEREEF